MITWNAPSARGSDIIAYKIEIADHNTAVWYTVEECDGSDPTTRDAHRCVVNMTTFTQDPFGY